ncbi:hypothetical protein BU15DRAFT_89379 [Melanogaster broomeanus]|nr:hypothetical protein BU15DRAFT_89379 [Melanogaster broomeanus]
MLVEDDFPLCGAWGWEGLLGVMNELERGRNASSGVPRKLGGFVGLWPHNPPYALPILTNTLRLYASTKSPLPSSLLRRPTDIIIQDCLLGADPLYRTPSMVITSRLIMDHIGGNASTATGRKYDLDKWRCGWRHPFHGRPEVFVVPV